MSLLPNQIIPQTMPFGSVNADGKVIIEHDWWLFLYNLAEQVLSNGTGATTVEIAQLGLFQAKGADYERQIAILAAFVSALPNPAGRIATLEKRVADLELLMAQALKVWN